MEQNFENRAKSPKWLTANNQFYARYKNKRAELKNDMTEAELKLWEHLRNKKLGVKFRRQHVIDFYIPDFVALSIKLIVEVDGKIHLKQKKEDSERTKRLEVLGYKIIRFTNDEIENDILKVLNKINMNIELLKCN
ncbi:MAG TPA: endonuclease domain-containing protein [Mariniphaga anaerophila]|uniref:Endonuclease domain-containing protein n=1 Tax=Mariniphaga anaerophila TaxID=1484053 RepID=A0A831LXV4_9BACT|nr:endonuclease domain-containing protein [Mariniphaga anaerophila]